MRQGGNQYGSWRVNLPAALAAGLTVLAAGNVRAVDLKIVSFLQDDLQELFGSVDLAVPDLSLDRPPVAGPVSHYFYDDCLAQFGTGADGGAEAEFVIDFARTEAAIEEGGIAISGGVVVAGGEEDVPLVRIIVSEPGHRGALHYLVNRLAHLCRTGR